MHVFRFREFGLKTPIHAPKFFSGVFDPLNEKQCEKKSQKAYPCASPSYLSHHASESVDGSDLQVSFQKKA